MAREGVEMNVKCVATMLAVMALSAGRAATAQEPPAPSAGGAPRIEILETPASRPKVLWPLYVGLGALQVYDGYTTLHGVHEGISETNPLVGGLAANPAAFWSVKAATTAVTIFFAETSWRSHHPTEAVVLMVVANGVMAAVAVRNTAAIR